MAKRKRAFKKFKGEKNLFNSIPLPKIPEFDIDPETKRGIFVVFILTLGALGVLSLFQLAGNLGIYYIKGLTYLFGWGRFVIPFLLLLWGFLLYRNDQKFKGANYLGLLMLMISGLAFFQLLVSPEKWIAYLKIGKGGGQIGYLVGIGFMKIMGYWASWIVFLSLMLVSLMLLFETNLYSIVGQESPIGKFFGFFKLVYDKIFKKQEIEEEEKEDKEELGEAEEEEKQDEALEHDDGDEEADESDESDEEDLEEAGIKFKSKKTDTSKIKQQDNIWIPSNIKIELPLELLSNKQGKPMSGDIGNNKMIIERTLKNFGIEVEMGEISVGPTVTQYTFKPAEGVKLSRITALNNNMALALAAHPIRIEAPIPGKALVGVEVPNQTKAIVGLREILSSKEFKQRKSNLTIALGKDVAGKCWSYDVAKMPHLLVAGATNSGKSVCLNSIIISLLYQNNPDDLRLILVDPKRVEMNFFNGIPHLLTPVITEVDKTINAMRWCLNEMDRRFDLLKESRKRNIQDYNSIKGNKLPYLIFIVDELADLMMVARRDIEAAIIRLAQLARAVGIHLVLATQRPSVDIITGVIKANMPARIAFAVSSSIDSRTILTTQGAEKLLGSGDMLFVSPDMSKPRRLQGTYISDNETKKIVRYIKERCEGPIYIDGVTDRQKVKGIAGVGMDNGGGDGSEDELFEEAKEVVINMGRASTSLLQRRLKVGYGRAAKLVDMLEEAGVVGPSNGSKAREILISREQYEAITETGVSGMPLHRRDESQPKEKYLPDEDEEEDEEEADDEDEDNDEEEENNENEEEVEENEDEEEEEVVEKPVKVIKKEQSSSKKSIKEGNLDADHDFRLFSK